MQEEYVCSTFDVSLLQVKYFVQQRVGRMRQERVMIVFNELNMTLRISANLFWDWVLSVLRQALKYERRYWDELSKMLCPLGPSWAPICKYYNSFQIPSHFNAKISGNDGQRSMPR